MLLASPSPAFPGDRPEYTYRTGVGEVRLTFSATDQNDHGVATLQATDFAVVDKGVIVRDYQSFSRTDYTRLQIVILLDSSESVSRKFRREVSATIELLSRSSGIPEENISLISFRNGKPVVICAGNCRTSHAEDQLPSTQTAGTTPLYDTITFASEFLAERGDAQTEKALILFSDGQDTTSLRSLNDAIEVSIHNDVRIYSIDLARGATPGTPILQAFAHATGGHYYSVSSGANQALDLLLEGFHASYTVTYRLPSHARGFHDIRILPTHNLNLQFRSRSGYYFPN